MFKLNKNVSLTATILLLMLLLAACGDTAPTNPPAATTTTAAPATTTSSAATTTGTTTTTAAVTTTASTTRVTTTTAPATTTRAATNEIATALSPVPASRRGTVATGTPIPGLGKELEGQKIGVGVDPNSDVFAYYNLRVVKTAAYESFQYGRSNIVPKNGACLVVLYELVNLGKTAVSRTGDVSLQDTSNKPLPACTSTAPFASLPDPEMAYSGRSTTNPGLALRFISTYDIARDAQGLKLVVGATNKTRPAVDNFALPAVADSGAGAELVGLTSKDNTTKGNFKVTRVERLGEIKAEDGVLEKTDGVFLAVLLEVSEHTANVGYPPSGLKDEAGRIFRRTDNNTIQKGFDILFKTDMENSIPAGQTGLRLLVFEVPKDAKGFKLL